MDTTNMQTFDQAIQEMAAEVATLVTGKHRDYGTKNILNCPLGAEVGIIVRLHDKLARMSNLIGKENPKNESVEDTLKDIAGYALIALMVRRGTFTLPLKED